MSRKIQLTPIEFPVFKAFIDYFIEPDRERATAFIKERTGIKDESCFSGDGATLIRKGQNPIVWLRTKHPSTIAHEMTHAVLNIMDETGIPRTYDTDEVLCYHVGYAMEQILK